jgi:putative sterol carrier protein
MTLDEITSEIRGRVAANGGIKGKTVKFHFGDDGAIRIDSKGDEALVDNEDSAADCTVKISKADFLEMAAGFNLWVLYLAWQDHPFLRWFVLKTG